MYDIFSQIRNNLDKDNSISTPTLFNLTPSSQLCIDLTSNTHIGSCPRQLWFLKNDVKPSNRISVTNISHFAGNWFEDWFINQLKEIGVYFNSGFSATDPSRFVKGIVDVAFYNKATNEVELGEIKTYDGSNYYNSQSILGNKSTPPKPKDKHLLQAFRYSLIFKDKFKINNLFYIDRACSQWYKNKQFKIELVTIKDNIYPKISTIWNDEYYEYIDTRISSLGIYKAEEDFIKNYCESTVPIKPFIEEYSEDIIQSKYNLKEISDYYYNKYKKDSVNNPIGDSACKFCTFSKGVCKTYEEFL